jgi:hypothetical protein
MSKHNRERREVRSLPDRSLSPYNKVRSRGGAVRAIARATDDRRLFLQAVKDKVRDG